MKYLCQNHNALLVYMYCIVTPEIHRTGQSVHCEGYFRPQGLFQVAPASGQILYTVIPLSSNPGQTHRVHSQGCRAVPDPLYRSGGQFNQFNQLGYFYSASLLGTAKLKDA
jgi:hypothetical protein